jgi:hypothetical protein
VEESLAGLAAEGIDPAAPGAFALDTLEGYPTKSLLEMEREVLTEDDRYAGGFCVVRAEVWSLDGETHLDDEDRTFGWFPIIEPMVPKGVPLPTYDYEPKP